MTACKLGKIAIIIAAFGSGLRFVSIPVFVPDSIVVLLVKSGFVCFCLLSLFPLPHPKSQIFCLRPRRSSVGEPARRVGNDFEPDNAWLRFGV